jgi:hypothetical protein
MPDETLSRNDDGRPVSKPGLTTPQRVGVALAIVLVAMLAVPPRMWVPQFVIDMVGPTMWRVFGFTIGRTSGGLVALVLLWFVIAGLDRLAGSQDRSRRRGESSRDHATD